MSYRRNATEEQKAAARERRAKLRELSRKIAEKTPEERRAFAAHVGIRRAATGEEYSIFNQCLIAAQMPSASFCAGFRQWKALGRRDATSRIHCLTLMPPSSSNA